MKSYRVMGLVLVASLICLVGTVRADFVPNGEFTSDISGWMATGTVNWLGTGETYSSPEGGSAAMLGAEWLYQPGCTTGPAFVAGQTYELSFLAASIAGPGGDITANIQIGGSAGPTYETLITPTSTWTPYSVAFTATADDVGKSFQPAFLGVAGTWIGIDSVSLSVVDVPEPSTLTMLVAGLVGLLGYTWRKQR